MWENTFGDSSELDIAYSIIQTKDGSFIVAGETQSEYSDGTPHYVEGGNLWIMKCDKALIKNCKIWKNK